MRTVTTLAFWFQPIGAHVSIPKECGTCEWLDNYGDRTTCRRNPPTADGFPYVGTGQWCGEWRDGRQVWDNIRHYVVAGATE